MCKRRGSHDVHTGDGNNRCGYHPMVGVQRNAMGSRTTPWTRSCLATPGQPHRNTPHQAQGAACKSQHARSTEPPAKRCPYTHVPHSKQPPPDSRSSPIRQAPHPRLDKCVVVHGVYNGIPDTLSDTPFQPARARPPHLSVQENKDVFGMQASTTGGQIHCVHARVPH